VNCSAVFRWLTLLGLSLAGCLGPTRLMAALPVSEPLDDQLYYRRTHAGAWPPVGVNSADHSAEITNATAVATTIPATVKANGVTPQPLLDNNDSDGMQGVFQQVFLGRKTRKTLWLL